MSVLTPHSLNVLLAWPEPISTNLLRQLQPLRPQVDVTLVPAGQTGNYLQEVGYYQVLIVTTEVWRSLARRWRQRRDAGACLVILGPGLVAAADLADAASVLYMPAVLSEAECVALVTALHQALSEGRRVAEVIATSSGRLELIGSEPAWPAAQNMTPAGSAPAKGGIGKVIHVAEGDTHTVQQTVTSNYGITIGAITVEGDMVAGGKVVYQAGGDQVNVTRGGAPPAKLGQSADGDQLNISRLSNAPSSRLCPQCERQVQATDHFCQGCGLWLDAAAQ